MSGKSVVAGLLCLVAGFIAGRMSVNMPRQEIVVEKWTDTVVVRQPEIMVIRSLAPDTAMLTVVSDSSDHDTTTVKVEIPREQKEYQGDGYCAWVSGYRPSLDSLRFEREITTNVCTSQRRWSVGLQAGIGITPRGVQPYIGIGLSLRLY